MVSTFPFSPEFVHLRAAMRHLLDETVVPSGGARYIPGMTGSRGAAWPVPLDVYATADEAVIMAAIPGMNPDDLEITSNQNVVTLSGSVPSATESEQGKRATWYAHELWHGQFRRSVALPFEVEATKAEATFENGIVRIVLPRAEWTKPHKIAITNGSQQALGAGAGRS